MFTKILIANRGEIACRVIVTAKRMGIQTVAVYSDADVNALHVKLADEAVHIGAAPSSESYLVIDRVVAAALDTGAQAIHPGYGFLSENADFCRACEQANIVFIGPPVPAIEAMGSKSAAKTIMGDAGVPLVPGYHGDEQSVDILRSAAEEMGYPVLLKAVAGGGGKGMRQVWVGDEFDEALQAAKREAKAGFGNDDMLVEKYLTQPRHVEVQVFCDSRGNGVYLFERDCSVQRRHQKIIEEAPAPGMSEELRAQMGDAAVRAAQAINYVGAGTVEFLLDVDGSFYFMEMNTRLQVEHPVTEMITGQDLVEWQLKVANGEALPCEQAQLSINGHAFEARIYAEDPSNEFLPATGQLKTLNFPVENDHVRIDTGVEAGDEVSVYYDPMIAKLVVWDKNRDRALNRLVTALRDTHITGVSTNIEFLIQLAASAPFKAAELDTGFIDKHQTLLFPGNGELAPQDAALLGLALHLASDAQAVKHDTELADVTSPWMLNDRWRMNHQATKTETFLVDDQETTVSIIQAENEYLVSTAGDELRATAEITGSELSATIDGKKITAALAVDLPHLVVFTQSRRFDVTQLLPDMGDDAEQDSGGFRAPMNGTVVAISVEAGSQVAEGEALVVIEAMKMEHTVRAPRAGKVTEIYFAAGDLVDGGAELLAFEPDS